MVIEIIKHTPLWVFALLIMLLALGYQQSRDRVVKKLVIYILPLAMVIMSYFGVFSIFGVSVLALFCWLLGLAVTTYIGTKYLSVQGVTFNQTTGNFFIPGSWVPMLLIMAIFLTKYVVGVLGAIAPVVLETAVFTVICSTLYGAYSGLFIARAVSIAATKSAMGVD